MELKDIRTIILGIVNRLKKTVLTIQGKVDVDFPETQKVEVVNQADIPDSVAVSNLDDVVSALQTSVGEVAKLLSKPQAKPEEIKPSLIKGLADVKKAVTTIKIPETKFPDLSDKFAEVVSAVGKIDLNVDLGEVVKGLKDVQGALGAVKSFTRHNEVRMYLNEKQLKELTNSFGGGTMSAGGSTGPMVIFDDVEGRPVHVVGDGDKYVVSNVSEGAEIGVIDAIPVAGEDDGGKKRPILIDNVTGALEFISFAHHEIHEGDAYVCTRSVTLGVGGDDELRIVTPNTTKWAHMTINAISNATLVMDLYEATSLTAGTSLTAYNRNRNSASTATTTVAHTPSGSGDGTLIFSWKAGSGNPVGGGADASSRNEFILKQNTAYLLRLTGANTNEVQIALEWYEHTSKY